MVRVTCPICNETQDLDQPKEGDWVECPQCESLTEVQRKERRWVLVAIGRNEVDELDLTRLPGIDEDMERKLKALGYESYCEIADADVDVLASDAGITIERAEKIIAAAMELLDVYEEE
jgi:predicted flap endonuclease-1-like 5' DNA nuclease